MDTLRITMIQSDIVWENKQENLRLLHEKLIPLRGQTELVVLPEMFSTGFSMNSQQLAEPVTGTTISCLKQYAAEGQFALCGSFIAEEDGHFFNRGFFISPDGSSFYYDKRHLFRMGKEPENFTAGSDKVIIPYLGWNICLLICYDLRFPVFCRNVDNEYDLLLFVASWPTARRSVWDILLKARAVENNCYACGVNRVGTDQYGIDYNGGSITLSARGETLAFVEDGKEEAVSTSLSLIRLQTHRRKFPTWKDADSFQLF